jgi:hypothetical protein
MVEVSQPYGPSWPATGTALTFLPMMMMKRQGKKEEDKERGRKEAAEEEGGRNEGEGKGDTEKKRKIKDITR